MALGVITNIGRILMAKLLKNESGVTGITHLAVGDGDGTFINPVSPPPNEVSQTELAHERARKTAYRSSYLIEVGDGTSADIIIDGQGFDETDVETNAIGLFFRLEENEANGITIREYGLFGGDVEYRPEVVGNLALNGVYDPVSNPNGEVENPGYLFEVKNIPDFHKTADTRFELVGVVKL